ncbi:MBL fold metallo-hydrolase [Paraflavitalea speifideaquila]|uniref:MBL fold metallo-hydrolase n=1 Tax=Paraflavitalea speifideaquila TaxID=3076558 RepID=UPI0028E63267|nr:MBL fold metallo-hydrolase [Paraflavitalea speifideiaquila]
MNLTITHIDTACILLEMNGYRILTDPTLDNAGGLYYHGFGAASRKTENPAVPMTSLQNIDLVLLSHHQHKDNLDTNGKAFLAATSARVLSTKKAAREMKQVTELDNWETISIETSKVKGLRITATPAQYPYSHPLQGLDTF